MTNQEAFDTVCAHLAAQKRRAVFPPGKCAYRTPEGLKCAVGCLIPDENYRPEMEGRGYEEAAWIRDKFYIVPGVDENLLQRLQFVHDGSFAIYDLKRNLHSAAADWGLDGTAVESIQEWEGTR